MFGDSYGGVTLTPLIAGAVEPELGYTGAVQSPPDGEDYLRARRYEPMTGRFTSADPAPQEPGHPATGTYLYVQNQPLIFTDPSGMCIGPDIVCHVASHIKHGLQQAGGDAADAATAAYAYAASHTVGGCHSTYVFAGIGFSEQVCIAFVGGRPTLLITPAGGGGGLCAGNNFSFIVSNASDVSQLRGAFGFAGISAGDLAVQGDTVAFVHDSNGNLIVVNEVNVGGGFNVSPLGPEVPFAAFAGISYTFGWYFIGVLVLLVAVSLLIFGVIFLLGVVRFVRQKPVPLGAKNWETGEILDLHLGASNLTSPWSKYCRGVMSNWVGVYYWPLMRVSIDVGAFKMKTVPSLIGRANGAPPFDAVPGPGVVAFPARTALGQSLVGVRRPDGRAAYFATKQREVVLSLLRDHGFEIELHETFVGHPPEPAP